MNKEKNIDTLPIDGGVLCLNFVNTVDSRTKHGAHEYLSDYQQFMLWCNKVEITADTRLDQLAGYAKTHKKEASQALTKIISIRENLYLLFATIASGQVGKLDQHVLHHFNTNLAESLSHLRFKQEENHLIQTFTKESINLCEPVWVIVKSAYDLLIGKDYERIKLCHAPDCGWLFLDHTKNNKRRWCNPSTCGSIEKSKRYYRKKKNKMHQ